MAKTTKPTIMIVEDDELLLRALYLFFHTREYTIASATDGDTGFKMIQRIKPDIILLDLLLPKMNGFDVLKNMKADTGVASIPVVVLSNLGDDGDILRAKSLGAADYFIKANINLADLEKKISQLYLAKK